jgi:hypothetical protein
MYVISFLETCDVESWVHTLLYILNSIYMKDLTSWSAGDEDPLALDEIDDHDTNTFDGDKDNSTDDR